MLIVLCFYSIDGLEELVTPLNTERIAQSKYLSSYCNRPVKITIDESTGGKTLAS